MNTNRLSLLFPVDSNEEVVLWAILGAINRRALVDKNLPKSIWQPATEYKVSINTVWFLAMSRPRRAGHLIQLSEFLETIDRLDDASIINADFPYDEISIDDNLYELIARSWAQSLGVKKFHVLSNGEIASPLHPATTEIWATSPERATEICMNRYHRTKRLHDQQVPIAV